MNPHVPPNETKQERIRRVARCWYWRNRERIREKKLDQTHAYRRRLRAGRPPKTDKTMFFNTETGILVDSKDRFVAPPVMSPEHKTALAEGRRKAKPKKEEAKNIPSTEIVSGKFFVSFD